MSSTLDIQQVIIRFIEGADTSIQAANQIEVTLDDLFPADAHIQDTVVMLAMYRPGASPPLLDVEEIRMRLVETLEYLQKPT